MNITKLLALLMAFAVSTAKNIFRPRRKTADLANIAEGQHLSSQGISYKSDVVITERFLIAKMGASADSITPTTALLDLPVGVITDEAAAIGDYVNVCPFNSDMTQKVVASAAIARGAWVEATAAGRVVTLGVGVGTHIVIGQALNAASAAGDIVEIQPSMFLRVI